MFAGNKEETKHTVSMIAMDSLKDSFATSNINWEHHSCTRALKEFNELSLLIAETVLFNMEDVRGLPYISGCPARKNIKDGIFIVENYYTQKSSAGKYAIKKTEAFRKSFEKKMSIVCEEWKSQEKNFFKR